MNQLPKGDADSTVTTIIKNKVILNPHKQDSYNQLPVWFSEPIKGCIIEKKNMYIYIVENRIDINVKEICEIYSKYFAPVYQNLKNMTFHKLENMQPITVLSGLEVFQYEILKKSIINKSLKHGIFATKYRICPYINMDICVHDKNPCQNYRPINILSIFEKMFESLMYPNLNARAKLFCLYNSMVLF